MKQIKAYVCEHCNDERTLTTNIEWLKEHELLCEKNPANAKLPHWCNSCVNNEYSHTSPFWDGYHKQYVDQNHYKCTAENVKCTDKVCLQFIPKENSLYTKLHKRSDNNAE